MKVFVDGLIFAKQKWGGVSRIWREYLPRLSDQGIDIELLVPFFSRNFSLAEMTGSRRKIKVRRDFFYRPFRYFEHVKVRDRLIRTFHLDKRVDIFHPTYYSTVYAKTSRKVVTVYDMTLELMQNEFPARWTRWGMEIKKEVIENADAVIAISENTKKDILRLYENFDEKKISVVYPGFALPSGGSWRSFDSVARKFSLSFGSGEYLLHVGNRNGYKNFPVVVSLLEKKLIPPGFSFVCVGGEENSAFLLQLKEKGLSHYFEFIDYADDEELAALYRNAKALFPVFSSFSISCRQRSISFRS